MSIDTVRADHVGCYGYPRDTTPRLDRLAREGTFFRTAVSTSSWTLPAHMSLLTGLLPAAHGAERTVTGIAPGRRLVAEILREAGLRTAGFVSSPFLDEAYGFARGFETYRNFWRRDGGGVEPAPGSQSAGGAFPGDDEGMARSHRDRTGPEVVASALEWLAAHRREPFFLFVHLWEPHYDYIPPPPYDTLFAEPEARGTVSMEGFFENPQIRAGMPAAALRYVVSQYDGEIAFADALVGRLLDALARLGLDRETLVIVTSDHGEEFFEHGDKGHQRTLFDEVLLVPLVVRGPGVATRPEGIPVQASLVDVPPTMLAALGVAAPPEVMGEDLGPLLAGGRAAPRDAASRRAAVSALAGSERNGPDRYCSWASVRTAEWKTIRDCRDSVAAYALLEDAGERTPLDPRTDARASRWEAESREVRRWVRRRAALLKRGGGQPVRIDEDLEERLRALGYAE